MHTDKLLLDTRFCSMRQKKNLHGQDSEEFLFGPSENFFLALEGFGDFLVMVIPT